MNWLSTWFCVKIQSYTNISNIKYSRSKKGWCSMLLLKAEQELAVSPAHASYAKKLQITPLFIGPVHSYPDTFESATFSFRDGQSVHTHPVLIRTVLNPLSRVESFESATCIRIRVDSKSGYLFIQWCNKIDLSFLPTVNTVFTWQPLLMLCYQYSQRRLASSVPGSEIVGSAELRKLEHVSTNQIKVLRLRLTFFEDFDQSGF